MGQSWVPGLGTCSLTGRAPLRARCWRQAWMVLINACPKTWLTESRVPRHTFAHSSGRSGCCGVPEPELDSTCVTPVALLRRSRGDPEFTIAAGMIAGHHRSARSDRIVERHHGDLFNRRRPRSRPTANVRMRTHRRTAAGSESDRYPLNTHWNRPSLPLRTFILYTHIAGQAK